MKPTDFSHWFFIRSDYEWRINAKSQVKSSQVKSVQFNKYSFDDNGYFAVYDKDCRKFELHQRMRSAECQRQSPLNFS